MMDESMDPRSIHKIKERERYKRQMKVLNEIIEHVPKLPKERPTKVKQLRRVVMYSRFLQLLCQKLKMPNQRLYEIAKNDLPTAASKPSQPECKNKQFPKPFEHYKNKNQKQRAHIVFLSSDKQKPSTSRKSKLEYCSFGNNLSTNDTALEVSDPDHAPDAYVPNGSSLSQQKTSAGSKNMKSINVCFEKENILPFDVEPACSSQNDPMYIRETPSKHSMNDKKSFDTNLFMNSSEHVLNDITNFGLKNKYPDNATQDLNEFETINCNDDSTSCSQQYFDSESSSLYHESPEYLYFEDSSEERKFFDEYPFSGKQSSQVSNSSSEMLNIDAEHSSDSNLSSSLPELVPFKANFTFDPYPFPGFSPSHSQPQVKADSYSAFAGPYFYSLPVQHAYNYPGNNSIFAYNPTPSYYPNVPNSCSAYAFPQYTLPDEASLLPSLYDLYPSTSGETPHEPNVKVSTSISGEQLDPESNITLPEKEISYPIAQYFVNFKC